ncbi:MAG: hypothetical protein HDQ88_04800 [Clostridia bacterium]|nr:hypothetical protein [Clostridia bacterium]
MEKEYDIASRYRRIYEGIKKWQQIGYKGIFQYTERMNLPTILSSVIEHNDVTIQEPFTIIVVPNLALKDTIRKVTTGQGKIKVLYIQDYIDLHKKFNGISCSCLIIIDVTNNSYYTNKQFVTAWSKTKCDRLLGITSKSITPISKERFAKLAFPIIDVITKQEALDNGWISPTVIYNVGLEFTSEEKNVYRSLTENITNTISIFKGKTKMINHDFKKLTKCSTDLIADDFALITACARGLNWVNNLTDKAEHIHSELVRNMLANIMGWKEDLDLSNDYNKQLDMYWKPDNIKARAESFIEAVAKRQALYSNNKSKRAAIDYIVEHLNTKAIVLNQDTNIADYIETIPECMCYYKNMNSRMCYDENGVPYKYGSGAKKGDPKLFGPIGIKKECIKNFTGDRCKVIATNEVAHSDFDIAGLNLIVCTAPYCKPFYTVGDNKNQSPYINKVSVIIWLYMQDFVLDSDEYKTSKEKEKLINSQESAKCDIVWVNSLADVKF